MPKRTFRRIGLACLLFSSLLGAQQTAAPATKLDPKLDADIRKMMDAMGVRALMTQQVDVMLKAIGPLLRQNPNLTSDAADEFEKRFKAALKPQDMIDLVVPIYAKYYTDDDVLAISAFYSTPVGKKVVASLPQVMQEVNVASMQMGQQLGGDIMQGILKEHPEWVKQ